MNKVSGKKIEIRSEIRDYDLDGGLHLRTRMYVPTYARNKPFNNEDLRWEITVRYGCLSYRTHASQDPGNDLGSFVEDARRNWSAAADAAQGFGELSRY